MDHRKTIAAAVLALVVAASPAAFATQKRGHRSTDEYQRREVLALFARADVNRDGVLTRAEAEAFARSDDGQRSLRRLDRNRDGVISRREWRGDPNTFARLDRNRDGVISSADRTSRIRRFHGLDRNRDGLVSRSEWRGNDRSFDVKDRNNDGVLTGVELR